eukprot:scaffold42818_cov557-Amphora_coffeaeformis.AAC.1
MEAIEDVNKQGLIIVPADVLANEALIIEAEKHVTAAKCMREYANNKMKEARESKTSGGSWAQSKD